MGNGTNPRVQWKEFEKDDVKWLLRDGFIPASGPYDLQGTLEINYFTDALTNAGSTAELKLGNRNYILGEYFPIGWTKKNFPRRAPFEKDTHRTIKLDFRMKSNGTSARAFASLKPSRDVSFKCTWGVVEDQDRRLLRLNLSEDLGSVTIEEFLKGNEKQPISDALRKAGSVNYQSSGKDGLQFAMNWQNASVNIKQEKGQPELFHGNFIIGSTNQSITCILDMND
ncbi:MAG: hypothetical protein HY537_13680 [Deltaproteobacteria bacterium]|nr:hypothetical protein [Deltaproteobacteria bacterium]